MQISFNSLTRLLAVLAMAATLGACASPERGANNPAQQSGSTTMGSGMMGSMQSGGPMMSGQADKDAMCAMHRNMQNATREQRQSMMDQQMPGMSPEMRQRHMQMMQQHCQQPAARQDP